MYLVQKWDLFILSGIWMLSWALLYICVVRWIVSLLSFYHHHYHHHHHFKVHHYSMLACVGLIMQSQIATCTILCILFSESHYTEVLLDYTCFQVDVDDDDCLFTYPLTPHPFQPLPSAGIYWKCDVFSKSYIISLRHINWRTKSLKPITLFKMGTCTCMTVHTCIILQVKYTCKYGRTWK